MLIIILFLSVLALATYLFMQRAVFGKNPTGERLVQIEQSPNYKSGIFQNIEPTVVMRKETSIIKVLKDFINKSNTTVPGKTLPSIKTDLKILKDEKPTLIWFGHSSYLIKSKGFNILVDPVFSNHVAPVTFFGKSFEGTNTYSVADMPEIDLLLLTHDHYDHLDYQTITQLHPKAKTIVAPLGVDSHLLHWGVPTEKIFVLDWWNSKTVADNAEITATPARHFSGRGFSRAKTLWCSYVLKLNGYSIFIGGDSGYSNQFKKIGDTFGPFDIVLLESGQYGKDWPNIHMLPEEAVTAAQELNAKVLMPVHWAKFALAFHAWNDPIERLLKSAKEKNVKVTTPMIGEPVVLSSSYPDSVWWKL